jgi:hypothetical protein
MEAQLHTLPRPLTLPCGPAVFHLYIRCRRDRTAAERFTQGNAIRHLECVRHHRWRCIDGPTSIQIGVRLPARVHSRLQLSTKVIACRDSRIIEIQPPQVCGTSEIPEPTSAMQTISAMETLSGMGTIFGMQTIFVVTGKNTSSCNIPVIGIAIGTATLITGGMVTGAPSLTDRG